MKCKNARISNRTLRPGWHDKDAVLFHAVFPLLAGFVEQEFPDKHIDWSHKAVHRQAWKEIRDLYQWWKKKRPVRRSPLDKEEVLRVQSGTQAAYAA